VAIRYPTRTVSGHCTAVVAARSANYEKPGGVDQAPPERQAAKRYRLLQSVYYQRRTVLVRGNEVPQAARIVIAGRRLRCWRRRCCRQRRNVETVIATLRGSTALCVNHQWSGTVDRVNSRHPLRSISHLLCGRMALPPALVLALVAEQATAGMVPRGVHYVGQRTDKGLLPRAT